MHKGKKLNQAKVTAMYKKDNEKMSKKIYDEVNPYNGLKIEDAPTNATGPAVAGTGDDPVHWSRRQPKIGVKGRNKKYGQSFDVAAFLRRRKNEQAKKAIK